jgi:hypothetical protein
MMSLKIKNGLGAGQFGINLPLVMLSPALRQDFISNYATTHAIPPYVSSLPTEYGIFSSILVWYAMGMCVVSVVSKKRVITPINTEVTKKSNYKKQLQTTTNCTNETTRNKQLHSFSVLRKHILPMRLYIQDIA